MANVSGDAERNEPESPETLEARYKLSETTTAAVERQLISLLLMGWN